MRFGLYVPFKIILPIIAIIIRLRNENKQSFKTVGFGMITILLHFILPTNRISQSCARHHLQKRINLGSILKPRGHWVVQKWKLGLSWLPIMSPAFEWSQEITCIWCLRECFFSFIASYMRLYFSFLLSFCV